LGKQAVSLLEGMGYKNIRHYVGGMADWVEEGGPVEKMDLPIADSSPRKFVRAETSKTWSWSRWLDVLANWPLDRLVFFWLGMILAFGFVYWGAGIAMGWGLQAGNVSVKPDFEGLLTAIYFSFVTALSIGYGDVIPVGPLRVLAIVEGAAGLLIFGCLVSKLVSRRQEELTEEIHRTTFEDRLDRVRTNLHLVFSDLGAVLQLQSEQGALPGQIVRRLESTVRVFRGEMQTIHDLLYRTQVLPDEEALESLLANCLQSVIDLQTTQLNGQQRSVSLDAGLHAISNLANEICGECVPRTYAPAMKQWMDQIQELARKIA
jgi:Ion channel